ncbi:hypothetical protein ACQRBL_32475, partial [Bacillus sp. AF62]|uniref:hypothetical protein n=1 Tax=Bacillus sp. AF62 TaxID=3158960 RepID=UPI003D07B796
MVTNNRKSVAIYKFGYSAKLRNIAVLCAFKRIRFCNLFMTGLKPDILEPMVDLIKEVEPGYS